MRELQANDTVNNRYRVVRKLGAGAMGSVYLCEDSVKNNVKVALKILISENLDDQDVWAKGEYEALTRLRHPNLARVYNFGRIDTGKDYFIVSEFIKGLDLYSATEYLNYEELVDIIAQICRALEYIHSQGYVHFDIKPDNILVTRHKTVGIEEGSKVQIDEHNSTAEGALLSKPIVKLIDFGLAEKITGTFSFAIKGTLNYLAPEILNGQTPDRRADLYSLGVTLYQVSNRSLPFQEAGNFPDEGIAPCSTRAQLFEMHMKNHPEFLRDLILKLVEDRKEDRFQNAKEVIHFINKHSDYKFEVETEETRASYFYSPKLVGRKREMNLLKEYHEKTFFPQRWRESRTALALEQLEEGHSDHSDSSPDDADGFQDESEDQYFTPHVPALLLVTGEMGSGKSRLLEEFQHFLRLNDIMSFSGNCYEYNNKAYEPLIQILHEIVYRHGLDSDIYRKYGRDIIKLLPDLPKRREEQKEGSVRLDQDRLYFIERMSQLLIEAAQISPYVMVINNLHWVDDASIDLLTHFFDRLTDARREEPIKLLVVASQRPDEPTPDSLTSLLERCQENEQLKEIQIRPLKHAQISEFLCSMLGFTEVPLEFVTKLEEKTGGNPLFIVETLKALQDDGLIRHSSEGWIIKATNYDRIDIPQNMEDLIGRRFAKCEPLKREILEVLSVVDKPVSPKFLQGLERFTNVPMLVELRDLEQSGLVTKLFESGKLHFHIAQTKVREIIYGKIEDDKLCCYHGEIGAAFMDTYAGKEEEILEDLAYHYQRSDQPGKALELAIRAGDRLKAIYANETACDHYLYVLDQVEGKPEHFQLWVEIQERLGDLCTVMGRYEMADRSYSVLLEEEVLEGIEPARVLKIYINRGKVREIQGDYDSALTCYKDARNYLSNFKKTDLMIERIWVFNSIGWIYVNMGKYEKAMAISLEALRVIERIPERMEHAMVYNTIGSASFYRGDIQEAIKYHRRSLEIKENLENIPETIISLNHLASAFLASCEYGEALEHLKRALKTTEEIGDPYGHALTLHNFARLYFKIGQDEKGWECLNRSLKLSKDYSMRHLNTQNYVVRGQALKDQGDYSKAEGNFFRALTAFSKQGNRWGLCAVLSSIAELHRIRGNFEEGQNMLVDARRYSEEMDIGELRARCLLEEARFKREAGGDGAKESLQMLEHALALSDRCENAELSGEISYEMGETLVRMRLLPEATQYYNAAQAKYQEVFENLPPEFRDSYDRRQRARFRNWEHAGETLPPADPTGSTVSRKGKRGSRREISAEDSLLLVNELMVYLRKEDSLSGFLEQFLDAVVNVLKGETALWLVVDGQNLSLERARSADGELAIEAEEILCLEVIERALTSGSIYLADTADDPETALLLERSSLEFSALAVLVAPISGTQQGILYVTEPQLPKQEGDGGLRLVEPFLSLIPLAYQRFGQKVV